MRGSKMGAKTSSQKDKGARGRSVSHEESKGPGPAQSKQTTPAKRLRKNLQEKVRPDSVPPSSQRSAAESQPGKMKAPKAAKAPNE